MKIRAMTKWSIESFLSSFGAFYLIMLLLNLFAVGAHALHTQEGFSYNGNDISLAVMLLVIGMILFGSALRFGLASGVSRRSTFVGNLAALLFTSAAGTAVMSLLIWGNYAFTGQYSGILYMLYDAYLGNAGLGGQAALLAAVFCLSLAFGSLGYFLGGAFYRLGRLGRIVLPIALPVGLFGLLPMILTLLPDAALQKLVEGLLTIGRFLAVSPWRPALLCLAVAAFFLALSWLLIRRAPLKIPA